jgi:hypothetical protein
MNDFAFREYALWNGTLSGVSKYIDVAFFRVSIVT